MNEKLFTELDEYELQTLQALADEKAVREARLRRQVAAAMESPEGSEAIAELIEMKLNQSDEKTWEVLSPLSGRLTDMQIEISNNSDRLDTVRRDHEIRNILSVVRTGLSTFQTIASLASLSTITELIKR